MPENNDYKARFERELNELESSRENLVACLTEKKGMESFISKTTLEMIQHLRGANEIATKGEIQDVVIMFTDVRGFTRFSEVFGVKKVFEIINVYLSIQSKNIEKNHGVIDKFLGDGIMAIFENDNKELNALRAAIAIQNSVRELNYEYTKRAVLNVGVGIHTGTVLMGVLGEEGRKDYTSIGDNVNIASRFCSLAKGGEILFTKKFMEALPDIRGIEFKETMRVKGKKEPLDVYFYELDIGLPQILQTENSIEQPTEPRNYNEKQNISDSRNLKGNECKPGDILTRKEKELIAVGASIASGCQQCSDYHFVKVFEEGATVEEVEMAVHDGLEMIRYASEIMQTKAYTLMDLQHKVTDVEPLSIHFDRISLLVRIGAVVALNNITGIEKYIQLALQHEVNLNEIQMTTALAKVVAAKAREFADDKIKKSLDMVLPTKTTSLTECNFNEPE